MNKYYTPKEEEFHIGFEYELRTIEYPLKKLLTPESFKKWIETFPDKAKWNPLVFDGLPIDCAGYIGLSPFPWLHSTRVKCLDSEDIESLGWKYSSLAKKYFLQGSLTEKEHSGIWMSVGENNHLWIIDSRNELHASIFMGKIKSKPELKRLMEQLEI